MGKPGHIHLETDSRNAPEHLTVRENFFNDLIGVADQQCTVRAKKFIKV